MRFFKTTDLIYEASRAQIDTVLGFPYQLTISCMPPANESLHDSSGKVLLALADDITGGSHVAPMLASLLANNQVTEITEETYRASIPKPRQILAN